MTLRIAIIGAGLSGLILANRLGKRAEVTVFEKSRGVGGRMSTRWAEPFYFDHGAQFFTARDEGFKQFIAPHLDSGMVQEWKGKVVTLEAGEKTTDRMWFEPHYVAVPGMNSLCKKLAESVAVKVNCEIAPLAERSDEGWALFDKEGQAEGVYDWVIATAPPVQTCKLYKEFLPATSPLYQAKFLACYTMMLGFKKEWGRSWIGAKIKNSPLEWIAVNSSKPGRDASLTTLVVHSSNQWAEAHCDDDLKEAESFLRDQLRGLVGSSVADPDYFSLHRWRYALLDKAHDDESRHAPYFDPALKVAAVGDWCGRSRIEDVWLDANKLANEIDRFRAC